MENIAAAPAQNPLLKIFKNGEAFLLAFSLPHCGVAVIDPFVRQVPDNIEKTHSSKKGNAYPCD
jgi:hypothetical protein